MVTAQYDWLGLQDSPAIMTRRENIDDKYRHS